MSEVAQTVIPTEMNKKTQSIEVGRNFVGSKNWRVARGNIANRDAHQKSRLKAYCLDGTHTYLGEE
jgi:hypothetical protein